MTALKPLRNFGIIAHVDAGKTTLSERVLFLTGAIHKKGEVHDGAARTDSHAIEKRKGITIQSAAVTCQWRDAVLQLIDTPGHVDFGVEVERALRVLDGAVVVLDGVAGVEPQTESVWRRADGHALPRIVFVNKLDRQGADLWRCVREVEGRFGARAAVLAVPWLNDDGGLVGVVDVISGRAFGPGDATLGGVPARVVDDVVRRRAVLVELVSSYDDELLGQALAGAIGDDVLTASVRRATLARAIVPVLCGAAYKDVGVSALLDAVVAYLPDARSRGAASDALSGLAFKVVYDDFGAMTLVRLFSGSLSRGDVYETAKTKGSARVGRLVRVFVDDLTEIESASAGEIVGLVGTALPLGDTLGPVGAVRALEAVRVDAPVVAVAIEEEGASQERGRLSKALAKLTATDPSLVVDVDQDTGQTLLRGQGELHLEVAVERLRSDFGVAVRAGRPQVAYQETVRQPASATTVHKKQGGGPGQYAKVSVRLVPLGRGDGVRVVDVTRGGAVPASFAQAFERGARAGLLRGTGLGPVTDVDVTLEDGATHAQDSSELAFAIAGEKAIAELLAQSPTLALEPYVTLTVTTPSGSVGDVVGDLARRRATVLGQEAGAGDVVVVRARAPVAELFGYATDLRGRTKGRATVAQAADGMDVVPERVALALRER